MRTCIFGILILSLMFTCSGFSFAQAPPSAGQLEKEQMDLEENRGLREKIEKGEKVFIKKIIVKGATQLNKEELRELILPFQKHWLSEADIQHLADSLRDSYRQKSLKIPAISHKVEGEKLIINIEESKSVPPEPIS